MVLTRRWPAGRTRVPTLRTESGPRAKVEYIRAARGPIKFSEPCIYLYRFYRII